MIYDEREMLAFQIVRSAGNYLLNTFGREVRSETKPDASLVSVVDHRSESRMLAPILEAYPKDGILTEESPEKVAENEYRWVVDPLDGTHNFLNGFYDFGCGLSLEKGNELVFGICYFPRYHQIFWAEKGQGAFCDGQMIHVSEAKTLKGGLFFPDSNFRVATRRSLNDISELVQAGCSVRINGCSHRALMYVASGKALVAISRSGKPWDLSPGAFILKEAGGMITNEDGASWKIGSREIIATNGLVHSKVLDLIRSKNDGA